MGDTRNVRGSEISLVAESARMGAEVLQRCDSLTTERLYENLIGASTSIDALSLYSTPTGENDCILRIVHRYHPEMQPPPVARGLKVDTRTKRTVRRMILATLSGLSARTSGRSSHNKSRQKSAHNPPLSSPQISPCQNVKETMKNTPERRKVSFWRRFCGSGCCGTAIHPNPEGAYSTDRANFFEEER
jgi:hypothetical protein